MADKPENDAPKQSPAVDPEISAEGQQKRGGRTMLVRVDERNMATSYANAYRTHPTPEEVIIDLGINMVTQVPEGAKEKADGQITFTVGNRVIINYHTAKRLAITLGQIVRMREEQFGEIKLDNKGQ